MSFDPSVLGRSQEDLDAMSPEERDEAFREDINRAIDLIIAIRAAYKPRDGKLLHEAADYLETFLE